MPGLDPVIHGKEKWPGESPAFIKSQCASDDAIGRMVLRVPDGGDVRDEAIRVAWKSGDRYRVRVSLQQPTESFPIVNVKRTAFDAARVGAELFCRKTTSLCLRG